MTYIESYTSTTIFCSLNGLDFGDRVTTLCTFHAYIYMRRQGTGGSAELCTNYIAPFEHKTSEQVTPRGNVQTMTMHPVSLVLSLPVRRGARPTLSPLFFTHLKLAHVRSVSQAALNSSAVLANDLSRLIASGGGRPRSSPPTVLSSEEDLFPSTRGKIHEENKSNSYIAKAMCRPKTR